MKRLIKLRNEIDFIDESILNLLLKRIKVCKKIGKLKKIKNMPVEDFEREKEILIHLKSKCPIEEEKNFKYIKRFYEVIFEITKKAQR